MNAGYLQVSKELLASPQWEDIKILLQKNFKEVCRKEIGSGLIEIHGESELFEALPEGATGQYEALISYKDGGSVSFKRIQ